MQQLPSVAFQVASINSVPDATFFLIEEALACLELAEVPEVGFGEGWASLLRGGDEAPVLGAVGVRFDEAETLAAGLVPVAGAALFDFEAAN